MKHVKSVSSQPCRPAMAASLLEKESYIEMFGSLVSVTGSIVEVSQSWIAFKVDLFASE